MMSSARLSCLLESVSYSGWVSMSWRSMSRNTLAELRNWNGYLGSVIPYRTRSESDSDAERWLAELDSIRPIRVVSRLETCSLPSDPATKLRLPKVNSIPGTKVTTLTLIGAIKLERLISTTIP